MAGPIYPIEVDSYTISVQPEGDQNLIVIEPPLSEDQLDGLVKAEIISATTANCTRQLQGEVKEFRGQEYVISHDRSAIPFGRLILGANAMQEATSGLQRDIARWLADETVAISR